MTLEVTHWEALGVAVAVLVGTAAFALWRRFAGRPRALAPLLLRAVAAALLWCALARVVHVTSQEFARGTVVVDISESMDEGRAQQLLERALQYAGPHGELEVVPFAKGVATAAVPSARGSSFNALRTGWSKLNIGATNLEGALSTLLEGEGQSALLISDGFETEGGATRLLPQLAARGVKLFPLIPTEADPGARRFAISQLHVPLIAPAQKSVDIRVSLSNTTTEEQQGQLEIKHGDTVVLTRRVAVAAGAEVLVTAESDPQLEGMKEITATLTPEDRNLGQSIERAYLSSEEREKVLLLSGTAEDGRILGQALKEQAYQVKALVAGAEELSKLDLASYSVVLFNNIARADLPRKIVEGIPEYVRAGGGFAMLGGNRSFGLGGYIDSPIEPVLPVELVPPQAEKKRVNVGVALVLDKSGSMNQASKLDYAKEAANETIRNLKDDDFITVIGFDDAPFVVIRASRVGDVRYEAANRIGMLVPNGRTNLLPAIDEARRNLARVEAGRKHIIVLTDGRLPDEGPFYLELTRDLRMSGYTLSTVLLGGESDYQFLKSLADAGGGGFYQTNDARNLPRIFLQDVRVSTGERTMKETLEYEVRLGTGELSTTTLRSFPTLRGYVQTKPRPQAALELVALGDSRAEPLLASWRYGKGRAVAFTSDANGRWSLSWTQWPKFYQFWTEAVDSLRSVGGAAQTPLRFNLRSVVEQGEVKLSLEVFGERDPGEISAALGLPNGASKELSFARVTKGLYEARIKSALPGRYELRAAASGGAKLTPVAFYISGELFGERKGQGFNRVLLERLASETGGEVNPRPDALSRFKQLRYKRVDISSWFVGAAMLALVLSTLVREVPAAARWLRLPSLNRRKIKKSVVASV